MRTLLLLLLLILGLTATGSAARIVLVADAWPPYNNEADSSDAGFIVDIAREIYSAHGHQVDYKVIPWKVAIEETRKGTYDGLIGATTEEGAGFIFPSEPAGSFQVAFFVKKENPWRFSSSRSLQKVRLGVAEGYSYSDWLHSYIEANKKDVNRVQSVSGDFPLVINLRKLMAGHIDAAVAATATMNYTAKQLDLLDQLQYAGSGGRESAIYLVFSPARQSSRRYAEMFDAGLRQLRASGRLDRILARYGITDWKQDD